MTAHRLQTLIRNAEKPPDMMAVAKAYLGQGPVKDPVAAEAWLMRIMEKNDPEYAPRAMVLLAQEILHSDVIFTDADIESFRQNLVHAANDEKRELEILLSLADITKNRRY